MNYDAQQYSFPHGLATTSQLHLRQQQHQFQQQHRIFHQQQQQYSQAVPTSSVYHFQFGGADGPINRVLQHKDVHSMGMSANMQQPAVASHGFVQQPFIKQAVPVALDGNSVVINSLTGMIYSQQKSHVNSLPDLENRLVLQSEEDLAAQQGLVGIEMVAAPRLTEPSGDVLRQPLPSGMSVASQHIFYDKSESSDWLQPSRVSSAGGAHQTKGGQSTLPSFSHVWSQQKQVGQLQQHKHIQQYHSQQQTQHLFQQQQQQQHMFSQQKKHIHPQQQQHIQALRQQHIQGHQQQHIQGHQQQHIQGHQQFPSDPADQTLSGIQALRIQQKNLQQTPVQTYVLPQEFKCLSAPQTSLFSTYNVCQEAPQTGKVIQFLDKDDAVQAQVFPSQSSAQSSTNYTENRPARAITYTESGPPKFTVTLDSLSHSETFSLNHFSESPSDFKHAPMKFASGSAPPMVLDNLQPPQEWQVPQQQARLPKPFLHTSSMGSSFERCSSESSSFSSPPYTFTPPSSVDLMFSPDSCHLSKTASGSSPLLSSSSSSGRTSALSSSSSSFISSSSSPTAGIPMWPGIHSTDAIVPMVTTASSVASFTCTTATVVFSCSSVALTTTSVTSTTASPAERPHRPSIHSRLLPATAGTDTASLCPRSASGSLATTLHSAKQIQVPYSWHRMCENGVIVYVSPSGTILRSLEQICAYLLSDTTCKCGLECPLQLEECFSFDPCAESQPWTVGPGNEHLANLCNHRREVLALAAFHSSQAAAADMAVETVKKRQPSKSASAEALIVAPLKRLKTSITNAVNRHAVSVGHFQGKPVSFSRHTAAAPTTPPVTGSCSSICQGQMKSSFDDQRLRSQKNNEGMLSPSIFDDHRSRSHKDNEGMLSPSIFDDQRLRSRKNNEGMLSPSIFDDHRSRSHKDNEGMLSPSIFDDQRLRSHKNNEGMLSPSIFDDHRSRSHKDNEGMLSPSIFDDHRSRSHKDNEGMLSPSIFDDQRLRSHKNNEGMLSPSIFDDHRSRSHKDNEGMLFPSIFFDHRSRSHKDNEGMLFPSIFDDHRLLSPNILPHTSSQAENKSVCHQQFYDDQQMHQVDYGHHAFMPSEDSLLFSLGPRKEIIGSMPSPYSLGSGLPSKQLQLQPATLQLSHHRTQSASQDLFYPQSPVYTHLAGVSQRQTPRFHSTLWKTDTQSSPAAVPHSPRPYPANVLVQHSHCDHPQSTASLRHTPADVPSLGHRPLVDLRKGKSKQPKSKKEKQKHVNCIVDRSSPCSKTWTKVSKVTAVPSTSASFFGNPIVFVEQQTAIINSSIASCHMACTSPSPQCDAVKAATHRPVIDIVKAVTKRTADDTVRAATRRTASDMGKAATHQTASDMVKTATHQTASDMVKTATHQTASDMVKTATYQTASDMVKTATYQTASDMVKTATHQTASDTVKAATCQPARETVPVSRINIVASEAVRSQALRDLEKSTIVDKDEEDDQKTATDLDSNKSFSDTTDNNDSAYLSQTGSDMDRSDTADGLDSCTETKFAPVTSIYSQGSSKPSESRKSPELTHADEASQRMIISPADCFLQRKPASKLQPQFCPVSAVGQLSSPATESQVGTAVVIYRRPADTLKDDMEVCQKSMPSCLTGDLSNLLASNNWNIPALQQVLAQYSSGQPGQLNSTLQNGRSQTVATGAYFPASSLLSAAARAQLHDQHKVHITSTLAHDQHKVHIPSTLAHDQHIPTTLAHDQHIPSTLAHQQLNSAAVPPVLMDNLSGSSVSNSLCDLTAARVSPAVIGAATVTQSPHIQSLYPHMTKSASLVGNFMQLPAGSVAVNMLLPGNSHGQILPSDVVHTRTLTADREVTVEQETPVGPGLLSQTSVAGHQMQLPVASVMPSSLGANVAQCSPEGNMMLLNNLSPRMIVSAAMPPVPVSIVTNVTQSVRPQVLPAISLKQTVLGNQQTSARVLGAGGPITGTTPQAVQGRHIVNPTCASTQLVGNPPSTAQIVNTLSLQGLRNQLVISGPMQQVSPSISQLSPALAAQILANRGHQQLQQMSPSFLSSQLPTSASQNMVATVPLPALVAATSCSLDSTASAVVSANIHKNNGAHKLLDTAEMVNKVSVATDGLAPLSSSSLYGATSQPVFVIPHPRANPLVQVLAPAQTLNTSTSLTDVHLHQNALSQIFDQSQPAVQQMVNAVSLSGVQQKQQLQIVQLQQLMLQQFHNQRQNIQGITLPLNQTSSPGQATGVATPALVSASMPQQQTVQVRNSSSLHSGLSPLGQSYQLQQMPSVLAVQQVTSISSGAAVGVMQIGGVQASGQHSQTGPSLQQQSLFSDSTSESSQTAIADVAVAASQEPQRPSTALTQHLATTCSQSTATNLPVVKPCQPVKPKPKSKCKRSENKKSVHPETERNEEDVAATVQQILAQAVQQQRELSLAAKNQPLPSPKGKSKKSRSKTSQATKEHDLGRLASISDDVTVLRSDHLPELSQPAGVPEPQYFIKSSLSDVHQSQHRVLAASSPGLLRVSAVTNSSPGQATWEEHTVGDANPLGCGIKRSSISLKDHLSFIISKDKDGHSKRLSAAAVQPQAKTWGAGLTLQPTPLLTGFTSQLPATVSSEILFQSKI